MKNAKRSEPEATVFLMLCLCAIAPLAALCASLPPISGDGAGLPAGPFRLAKPCALGAAEELPLADGYLCAQRYDIPAKCDFRKAAPGRLCRMEGVEKVGYLLELENNEGDTSFAFAEMDAFDTDSDKLILTAQKDLARRFAVKNLRVRTNAQGVKGTDGANGFVEFYTCNYSPKKMDAPACGDAKAYDCNDTPQPGCVDGLGYGCLQIHNLDAKETVLAFNHFNSADAVCDVGLGNAPGGNPDWTFAKSAAAWKTRRISVWVKGRTAFLNLSHVHRGGGKLERPDNTLDTFLWCWENGSALECDCRKTKDGVGIMLHDKDLKRTGRGITPEFAAKDVSRELDWDDIKDVDVGSYLSPDFAHHRIPTIEATFGAIKGHPDWLCFVDEKGAGPEYIAKKALELGVQDQVYYTGPSHTKIFEWNEILPGGKSLLWLGAWPKNHGAAERARTDKWFRDRMTKLRAKDFKYISAISIHTYYDPADAADPFVPSSDVLREIVKEFHAHGIPVCSIPFQGGETEEVYFKLFELGFDGFSTDYPSVMFSVIKKLKEGKTK